MAGKPLLYCAYFLHFPCKFCNFCKLQVNIQRQVHRVQATVNVRIRRLNNSRKYVTPLSQTNSTGPLPPYGVWRQGVVGDIIGGRGWLLSVSRKMALRGVLVVVTLLVLGLTSLGTSLTETSNCVMHPLSPEVVQHLLAATNETVKHLQDVKSLLAPLRSTADRVDLRTSEGVVQRDASLEVMLLLLHKLEAEQARNTRQLEELRQQVRSMGGHNYSSSGEQHTTSVNNFLLESLLQLQKDVRQMRSQHLQYPTGDNTASQPRQFPSHQTQPALLRNSDCYSPTDRPRDCHDLLLAGHNQSGVYQIFPHSCGRREVGVKVWCDVEGESGWTVVLSRRPLDQQVNFNRGWADYRRGFGDPLTEYWIGNEVLHELTSGRPQVLRVELGDWDGQRRWVEYGVFLVEDADSQYRLHLGQFTGDAGDAFKAAHDNMLFTTTDRDNDIHETVNCAENYHGGFWYAKCHAVSPTGLLLEKQKNTRGITWNSWYPDRTTLKNVTFKLKPKSCSSW